MVPKPQTGGSYFKSYKALNLQDTFLADTLSLSFRVVISLLFFNNNKNMRTKKNISVLNYLVIDCLLSQ